MLIHVLCSLAAYRQLFRTFRLPLLERALLLGLIPVGLFAELIHPLLFAQRLPFLPLMLTSVYCAAAVLYGTGFLYHTFLYQ